MSPIKFIHILLLSIFLLGCDQGEKVNNSTDNSRGEAIGSEGDQKVNKRKLLSGQRCASIEYYNPQTGTSSTYTLFVEVESNRLVKVFFPDGFMDTEHFTAPEIDDGGGCTFINDKGYHYKVQILETNTACSLQEAREQQCSGITRSGNRCKHKTSHPSGRCYQHR